MKKTLLAVLAAAVFVALGWWAGQTTIASPIVQEEQAQQQELWSTATVTSVGSYLPAGVTVEIEYKPIATNHLSGVVTHVASGEKVEGDILYTVGQTPVRVVTSEVPWWRDLALGVKGDDVKVLQLSLINQGYLNVDADGVFGTSTVNAVKAWQRELGVSVNGRVALGELVGVPQLPAAIRTGEDISLGSVLSGGETAASAAASERTFAIHLLDTQADSIPQDAQILVEHLEYQWPAIITDTEPNEVTGGMVFTLHAPDGGVVCADTCDTLPTDPKISLRSNVQILPPTHGVGIPAAAVQTRPDMTAYVVTKSGETDVVVQAAGQGLAIVEGIEEGVEVLLPVPAE